MSRPTTDIDSIAKGEKPKGALVEFSNFLDKLKPQIALQLPKHMNADRMARLALSAFSSSVKLQRCDPRTIAKSLMDAGAMGLEPGVGGQGFLVPYKTTCTFVPGWQGLVDLVNRSGNATVYTGVIFKDQRYTFRDGSTRSLDVTNETDLEDASDITHAYAVGWVRGAERPVIELWRVSKVVRHRDKYNRVGAEHYSFRDFEMYARKVVLLQVLKYMPKSTELQRAMDASNATDAGVPYTIDGDFVTAADDAPDDQPPATGKGAETGQDKGKPAATVAEAEAAAASPKAGTDSATGEITFTFAEVESKLQKATTPDDLAAAATLIQSVADQTHKPELQAIYVRRLAELNASE